MSVQINLSSHAGMRGNLPVFLHSPSQKPGHHGGDDPLDIDSAAPSKCKPSRSDEEANGDKKAAETALLLQLLQIICLLAMQHRGDAVPEAQGKGHGGGGGGGGAPKPHSPERFNAGMGPNDHAEDPKTRNKPHSSKPHKSGDDDGGDDNTVHAKDGSDKVGKNTKTTDPETTAGKNEKTSKASGPGKMPEPTGTVTVNKPIVVKAGETFDGGGKLYKAGASLGDGGQSENQKPVFIIEPGGTLKNLQYEGADGIHTMGDAKIKDVWARDVGEDAMTMKKPGNVTWSGGGAFNANDKIFQLNAGGSFTLENFTADNFGKAIRTNGGKQIDTDIVVRNSHFTNGDEAIVRTDSTAATIKLEGVTFSNVPNDVLAPSGTEVSGAVKRGSK
jgi:hypothetical protein